MPFTLTEEAREAALEKVEQIRSQAAQMMADATAMARLLSHPASHISQLPSPETPETEDVDAAD